MRLTDDAFRALARSSPWRWRSAHLTWHDALGPGTGDARAWIRDRTLLRVEHAGSVQVERHEPAQAARLTLDGERTGGEPVHQPRPADIDPVRREDGLVLVRPDRWAVDDADPFWQTYLWLALLDPVELADGDCSYDPVTGAELVLAEGEPLRALDPEPYPGLGWPTPPQVPGTSITPLGAGERRGRETWWARVAPTWAYAPRCSCCPLLWGEVSEWVERRDAGPVSDSREYPSGYDIALDVETGICVHVGPVGPAPPFAGHDLTIHEVGVAYPDSLFEEPRRSGPLRRGLGRARAGG